MPFDKESCLYRVRRGASVFDLPLDELSRIERLKLDHTRITHEMVIRNDPPIIILG